MQGLKNLPEKAFERCGFLKKERKRKRKIWKHENGIQMSREVKESPRKSQEDGKVMNWRALVSPK